ncbi:hypothetical protein [Polyangium mundeleinium]|uniref:Transposase n=1 Tax=Polyangium mundeleinium TaxID=2995306 RepID=A0ABT5EKI8_9BACT|nr:hypothetical protein [Polyangium mundeleinium]MDC0742281.1 hypothetical protein [Polyangium mundeleinium]
MVERKEGSPVPAEAETLHEVVFVLEEVQQLCPWSSWQALMQWSSLTDAAWALIAERSS